ncbi:MAG TPA: hypothetical protein VJR89_38735 [Polyangiales bacterium]|nr:hypothetical protein [Polyangiales bacterium]
MLQAIVNARWFKRAEWGINVLGGLVLLLTFVFLGWESTWVSAQPARDPRWNFLHGSTGTELMPLPVMQVLPDLFPDQFQPAGAAAGDWVEQFGFFRESGYPDGVPFGFTVSNHRPRSGAPSPTPFVGISCSLCHSAKIHRRPDDPGITVLGMGTSSLDFIGWVDAFKTAVLSDRLTVEAIQSKYREKYARSLGVVDTLLIRTWLNDTRSALRENMPKSDRPYAGAELRQASLLPNGPSRTQPFRNLVRNVMDLPAATDRAFCKIPTLFRQQDRTWGQFDGSVRDRLTRSVLAAIAIGATAENLPMPDIAGGVNGAIAYTLTLQGPAYRDIFPEHYARLEPAAVERGKQLYARHCDSCHGHPDGDAWVRGRRQDEIVPLEEIGTDPARVEFRFYDELPDALVAMFPEDHPLRPKREELRPGPRGHTRGYLNTPLHAAFAHAPYLHNGSVMTLAELINLQPRRPVFYRGAHVYDPDTAGLDAPLRSDARHYFRFDTSQPGNGNQGHDYPWRFHGPGWDEAQLEDLLTYLKTI